MCVAVAQGLANRVALAGHVGVAAPVPARQGAVKAEMVGLFQAGHVVPVHPTNEFAPAQDLANKAFHAGQGQLFTAARAPGRLNPAHHRHRVDQVQVQRHRQQRVPAKRGVLPHRVLVGAKAEQPLVDEALQGLVGLLWGDRPGEVLQTAWVIGEEARHIGHGLAGDGVGLKARRFGYPAGASGGVGLAVVGVVVPLAAHGLGAVHQHLVLLALQPIEMLHAPLFAALGPVGKDGTADHKVGVGALLQRHAQARAQGGQGLFDVPFARLAQHQGLRLVLGQTALQPLQQIGRVGHAGVVDAHMAHRPAAGDARREMPHGRQKQRGARPVAPNPLRLAGRFDQQHAVLGRVQIGQGRVAFPQLIAQHQRHPAPPWLLAHGVDVPRWRRQRSLQ